MFRPAGGRALLAALWPGSPFGRAGRGRDADGDLFLSVIPAGAGDSELFARELYLSGSYLPWRLTLLLGTGLVGMALCAFAVWVCWVQILPRHIWLRRGAAAGGVIYLTSAGVLHFHIGSLADWTSTLAPLLGREETAALIAEKYARLAPALTFSYGGDVFADAGELLGGGGEKDRPAPVDAGLSSHPRAAGAHAHP